MTWLAERATGATAFEEVLGLRSDLLELYRDFYAQLWTERLVDPVILELCRLRVAQLHGNEAELALRYEPAQVAGLTEEKLRALPSYPVSSLFSPLERCCIEYAEKFVIDVHSITDEEAGRVTSAMSPQEFVAFTLALSLFDGFGRFKSVLGVSSAPGGVTVVPAPRRDAGPVY